MIDSPFLTHKVLLSVFTAILVVLFVYKVTFEVPDCQMSQSFYGYNYYNCLSTLFWLQ